MISFWINPNTWSGQIALLSKTLLFLSFHIFLLCTSRLLLWIFVAYHAVAPEFYSTTLQNHHLPLLVNLHNYPPSWKQEATFLLHSSIAGIYVMMFLKLDHTVHTLLNMANFWKISLSVVRILLWTSNHAKKIIFLRHELSICYYLQRLSIFLVPVQDTQT